MTTLRESVEGLRPDPWKCNMRELNNDSAYRAGYLSAWDAMIAIAADGDATIAALTGDVLYWGRQLSAAMERAEKAEAEAARLRERKDSAYLERNQVVAALAKCFPSGVARTAIEGWSEDWHGCVYIDMPTGQASWHFHDSQAYLFADLPPYAGKWDGHTTEEKYQRIASLATRGARIAELEAEQTNDTPLQMALDGLRATRERAEKAEAELERTKQHLLLCIEQHGEASREVFALRAEVARLSAPVGVEPTFLHSGDGAAWPVKTVTKWPERNSRRMTIPLFPESAIRALQARLDAAAGALDEADRIMGHDDAETEWRGKWAYLWEADQPRSNHDSAEPRPAL